MFASSLDKARIHTAEDTEATMQLTTGSYLAKDAPFTERSKETVLVDQPKAGVQLEKDSLLVKKSKKDLSSK